VPKYICRHLKNCSALQDTYSLALYGERNAVDVDHIDMLRTDLIALVANKGIRNALKGKQKIQVNEFFTGYSNGAEPRNVVFINRERAAFPPTTCFEVIHCRARPEEHQKLVYFYAARGSGRWVCHNDTRVIGYKNAKQWFPLDKYRGIPWMKDFEDWASNHGHNELLARNKAQQHDAERWIEEHRRKSRGVSSVQYVAHQESYNFLPHHEVLFLKKDLGSGQDVGQHMRCGLPGSLRKCPGVPFEQCPREVGKSLHRRSNGRDNALHPA
jgi:hypothetical protein